MSDTLRILHLEDRLTDAELVTRALREGGFEFVAKRVETASEFLAELRNAAPDLILADYSLPRYDGLSALVAAKKECPETPFIFVSGSMGEEKAIETLHGGATDYVLKDHLVRLVPAVRRALHDREETRKHEQAEKLRQEAEARHRAIFEQAPYGIVILDPETARPIEFNVVAHQQLGYSREEFGRLSLADIEVEETVEQTRAIIDGVRSGGKRVFETRHRTREGQIRHVQVTAQFIEASGRRVFHCVWRDITVRKQAEQRIREMNLMLRASGAINALMVRERDPQRLLAEACKVLVETRGYRLAWIGLVEAGSKRVLPAAKAGKDASFLDPARITWDETPAGQGPIGTAVRTGQPIACQDTATHPLFAPWKEAAKAYGLGSMAAIPMIHGSRSLGAVAVYSEHTGTFDAEELGLLGELASDLAFGLKSIELERERKRAEDLMRESERRYRLLFNSGYDAVFVHDGPDAQGRPGKFLEVNDVACRRLGYTREELLQLSPPDIDAPESARTIPVTMKRLLEEKHGTWEAVNLTKNGNQFPVEISSELFDLNGKPTFLSIIRDITERKRAEGALREQARLSALEAEVGTALTRGGTLAEMLRLSCEAIVRHLDAAFARIWTLNEREQVLELQASAGIYTHLGGPHARVPLGKHKIGLIAQQRKAQIINQVEGDARIGDPEWAKREGLVAFAGYPLLVEGRVAGVVAMFARQTLSEYALSALATNANNIALGIEGKRSEAAVRQREEYFRTLTEQAADVITILDGEGTIRYESPSVENVFGHRPEELVGRPLFEFVHPEDLARVQQGFLEVVAAPGSTTRTELRFRHKDGSWRVLEATTRNLLHDPNVMGIIANSRDITERTQLEKALRESGQFSQQIIASAEEGIIVYGRDLRCKLWNAFMERLTGMSASQVLGRKPEELFPFLRESDALHSIEQALAGESTSSIDTPFTGFPSGKMGWISFTTGPLRNAAGEIVGVIGIVRDITERKRAELRIKALSSLGLRLSAAKTVREAAEIICEVAGELLGWDACRFSMFTPLRDLLDHVLQLDTVEGRHVEYSPEYQPPSEIARRAIETGGLLIAKEKSGEMLPGGQPFGNSARPSASILYVPVRNGVEAVGLMTIQSYTLNAYDENSLETLQALADHCGGALDRLRMEEAWQTSQQRLSHLISQSPAVIYSLKTDGKTTEPLWVSDNVERLLGYTVEECHGPEGVFNQVHPQDRQAGIDGLVELLATKHVSRDYRIRHKNREYRWVRDEQRLVCDAAGTPLEIVGSWVDITERKTLEDRLRQAQKMEAVGQLAGGVAHDFNNMLAVIRGNAELLLMDEALHTPATKEGLQHVVEASERAANLTRQLLAFSRKQVLLPQPLVLNEVVASLTKMLKRVIGENIDLQCHYAAPLAHVQADTGMMEQVILNLVVNARDAMPEGGRLLVATEQVTVDAVHARAYPDARAGEFVCLLVIDTGSGIDPEVLPHIFEPFFTTKEVGKGTGLGLATVYGIVQQHQGWIEVSSEVGKGSTFKAFLPAIPTPAQPATTSGTGGEIQGGKEMILLVEDDFAVRLTTRRVLESKGYVVQEASCGREALELWHSHAGEIALLLTDIIMPEQMTGRELASQLWQQRPGLKVIFMSGYSAEKAGQNTDFIRRTKSSFLQKPCSARTLLETVRRCLDRTESAAAPARGGPAK